ncbi:hypothetical protein V5O48_000942 [Marasmius crinis-equi]|uniref:Uncharacterized protein n=1 Tax=Marasmius crinis-equi TaxID=585013 RepID=A0ABR3FZN8_9AGAR
MQVAYRPAVVRRLGPSSFKYRSNSTSTSGPSKGGLLKAASWGDIPLPGRGSLPKDRPPAEPFESVRARPGTLSERLKQWSRPETTPQNETSSSESSTQAPSLEIPDASKRLHIPPRQNQGLATKLSDWDRAVNKLSSKPSTKLPAKGIYAGTDWVPGKDVVSADRKHKATARAERPRREQRDNASAPGDRQPSRSRQGREGAERKAFPGRNRPRRDGERASGRRAFARKDAKEFEQEEEVVDQIVITGEEGIFEPQRGQDEEAWLTDYLAMDPEPAAPGNMQAEVDLAPGAEGLFATQTPVSSGLVNATTGAHKATPTRILRVHGGDYSHILPGKLQGTSVKELSIVTLSHLAMSKRREMQPTQTAAAVAQIGRLRARRPRRA